MDFFARYLGKKLKGLQVTVCDAESGVSHRGIVDNILADRKHFVFIAIPNEFPDELEVCCEIPKKMKSCCLCTVNKDRILLSYHPNKCSESIDLTNPPTTTVMIHLGKNEKTLSA